MQIAGAKGVHLQGQPGANPRLTVLGSLLGSVRGFVCDHAPRAEQTSIRRHIPLSNERP